MFILNFQVEDLTEEIQIKADMLNETTLRNEQLQMDIKGDFFPGRCHKALIWNVKTGF